jgi:hypothetical protein
LVNLHLMLNYIYVTRKAGYYEFEWKMLLIIVFTNDDKNILTLYWMMELYRRYSYLSLPQTILHLVELQTQWIFDEML